MTMIAPSVNISRSQKHFNSMAFRITDADSLKLRSVLNRLCIDGNNLQPLRDPFNNCSGATKIQGFIENRMQYCYRINFF